MKSKQNGKNTITRSDLTINQLDDKLNLCNTYVTAN